MDLAEADQDLMKQIRGNEIGMIFQEPMTALNPVFTVGRQLTEGLRIHKDMSKTQAEERALELLRQVRIPEPERRSEAIPARAVRRHASARGDCNGDGLRAAFADCRRADDRPGRDHSG